MPLAPRSLARALCFVLLLALLLLPNRARAEGGPRFTPLPLPLNAPAPGTGPRLTQTDDPVTQAGAWGDFDADGDLDLALALYDGAVAEVVILANQGGEFTLFQSLPGALWAALAWTDLEGDVDLDLAVCGENGGPHTWLYAYDRAAGRFVDVTPPGWPGISRGALAWWDADADGDTDLASAGRSATGAITRVARNDGAGRFTVLDVGLPGVEEGALAWSDPDADGGADLALAGLVPGQGRLARFYRRQGEGWVDGGLALTAVDHVALSWSNHHLFAELLLVGQSNKGRTSRMYHNDYGRLFEGGPINLPTLSHATMAWSDFNHDQRMELTLMGRRTDTERITRLYAPDGQGRFGEFRTSLPGLDHGSAAWGDAENDGDLDLLLVGHSGTAYEAGILRVEGVPVNAPPAAPQLPAVSWPAPGTVNLGWWIAFDEGYQAAGISYNLRVGTTPGGQDVLPALARTDGRRLVPAVGNNAPSGNGRTLHLPPGLYYWGVQAVDAGYAGGPFAEGPPFAVMAYNPQSTGLPLTLSHSAWGDYDADGDLDLLAAGWLDGAPVARLFRADDGRLVESSAAFAPGGPGPVGWLDLQGDGYLDAWVGTQVYRQAFDGWRPLPLGLPALNSPVLAWGDYDRDGNEDLALAGIQPDGTPFTRLYRRVGGAAGSGLTLTDVALPLLHAGALAWADYDQDDDLDLLVSGAISTTPDGPVTRATILLANRGRSFHEARVGLEEVGGSKWATWGDADADGDPDLLLAVEDWGVRVFRNDQNAFTPWTDVGSGRETTHEGAWGDMDNDGDLDVVLAGVGPGNKLGMVLLQEAGAFRVLTVGLPFDPAGLSLADADGDGDLDILVSSVPREGARGIVLCRSEGFVRNAPPAAPTTPGAQVSGERVLLRWGAAADDHTPPTALTYNLRVGTHSGAADVMAPLAPYEGRRRVAAPGNAGAGPSYKLRLRPGTYYWAVQAVDGAYQNGPWTPERSFTVTALPTPAPGPTIPPGPGVPLPLIWMSW